MGTKNLSAIRATVRQLLRDEYLSATPYEFDTEELNVYIGELLVEVSQARPNEVRETKTGNGTTDLDISSITKLLELQKVEYPVGSSPRSFVKVSLFGTLLHFEDVTPGSGETIYLYCHEAHELTESLSTLTPDLEKVLVEGTVVKAALGWLNKMRDQIIPASIIRYQNWANTQYVIYQNNLSKLTKPRVWEY